METYTYTNLDDAIEAVESMFRDYSDSDPDEIGHDVVSAVAAECEPAVARELKRVML